MADTIYSILKRNSIVADKLHAQYSRSQTTSCKQR